MEYKKLNMKMFVICWRVQAIFLVIPQTNKSSLISTDIQRQSFDIISNICFDTLQWGVPSLPHRFVKGVTMCDCLSPVLNKCSLAINWSPWDQHPWHLSQDTKIVFIHYNIIQMWEHGDPLVIPFWIVLIKWLLMYWVDVKCHHTIDHLHCATMW